MHLTGEFDAGAAANSPRRRMPPYRIDFNAQAALVDAGTRPRPAALHEQHPGLGSPRIRSNTPGSVVSASESDGLKKSRIYAANLT